MIIYSEEYKNLCSDEMCIKVKNGSLTLNNSYSRCKRDWFVYNDKKYFMRSSWEINYANYLIFLQKHKNIQDWTYEEDTFWFEKIKRGARSYKPDFKIINNDGSVEYHEIKGWLDQKSKTKLSRMQKYYPNVKLILIDQKAYKNIMKNKKLYER